MNKPFLSLAIIMLIAFSFTCCSNTPKQGNNTSSSTIDSAYINNDTLAMYMGSIGHRLNKPKYEPDFEDDGSIKGVYPELTTNSDKMPVYSIDTSLPNQNLLQQLADCYNSARILMSSRDDVEVYERFGDAITDVADCIGKLDCDIIHNLRTRAQAEEYKTINIKVTSVPHDELDDCFKVSAAAWSNFWDYIVENYKMSHYGNLSQEETDEVMNPNNYLADWQATMEKIIEGDLDIRERIQLRKELVDRYEKAENFHQKCLLGIQITHLDEKYGTNNDENKQTGLAILEDLLMAKEYSYFLYQVFCDWRCLKQYGWGLSNDSSIPNYYYNMLRCEAFDTMIRYIADHPKDLVAINVANYLSLLDDIYRYLFVDGNSVGNYNIAEYFERFG